MRCEYTNYGFCADYFQMPHGSSSPYYGVPANCTLLINSLQPGEIVKFIPPFLYAPMPAMCRNLPIGSESGTAAISEWY